jgi:hypothetical protein
MTKNAPKKETQRDKFIRAARELEVNESEQTFNAALKKVAKAPMPKEGKSRRKDSAR